MAKSMISIHGWIDDDVSPTYLVLASMLIVINVPIVLRPSITTATATTTTYLLLLLLKYIK